MNQSETLIGFSNFLRAICKPIKNNIRFFIFMYLLGCICILADPTIDKSRTFLELFLDDYILCLFVSLFPQRISSFAKVLFSGILYSIAIIDVYCLIRIGTGITPTLVQLTIETDGSEASEALAGYIELKYIISSVLLILLLAIIHFLLMIGKVKMKKIGAWINNSIVQKVIFFLIIVSLVLSFRPKKFMTMCFGGDHDIFICLQGMGAYDPSNIYYIPIYKLLYSYKENTFGITELDNLKKNAESCKVDSCSFLSPNIILIIGESHSKHHSQLYGYDKEVSPFQKTRSDSGDLVAFNDVVSSYYITTNSFKNMFSLFSYGDKGDWSNYPLFPVLFKKAGYHTAFITNQFMIDLNANFSDFDAGMFFNNNTLNKAMFDTRNVRRHQYDEGLLEEYDSLKQYNSIHNLLIFHLRGLHFAYKERYPQKWNKFKASDYHRSDLSLSDRQILAEYDNSALYNDFILNEIIKQFEKEDAVVIYVPDHGEECFDGCQTYGRPARFAPIDIYQQFQIPFWIYMTKVYQANHRDMVEKIKNSKNKPLMTDHLGNLLLTLGGIHSAYNPEAKDIFCDNYQCGNRMIMGQINYEKMLLEINKSLHH